MEADTFTVAADDGTTLHVRSWAPEVAPRGAVVVAHGMAEHAGRYARFAAALADEGYATLAHDHRGHGATAGSPDALGFLPDGADFGTLAGDLHHVVREARSRFPGVPVHLLGHSMGSIVARDFLAHHAAEVDTVVLSGAPGDPGALGRVGQVISRTQSRLRGADAPGVLLGRLSFGRFNAAFKPTRTDVDWLSRDPAEVDAYVADPWCGAVSSAGMWAGLITTLYDVTSTAWYAAIPVDLPFLLVAGDRDPSADMGRAPRAVADGLRAAGVQDVTVTLWPEARHEVLNETNRGEVTAGIIGWLDARAAARG